NWTTSHTCHGSAKRLFRNFGGLSTKIHPSRHGRHPAARSSSPHPGAGPLAPAPNLCLQIFRLSIPATPSLALRACLNKHITIIGTLCQFGSSPAICFRVRLIPLPVRADFCRETE